MKNENIKTKISLLIFLLVLVATCFCSWKNSLATEEDRLILTEVLPNPTGSSEKKNEFIEIYNSSDSLVDLTDWTLSGKAGTFSLSGELKAKEYKAFYDTITLYNDKSTIELLNAGVKVDNVSYPDPKQENFSYSFDGKNWKWTSKLTPGEKNIFDEDIPSEEPDNTYSGKLKINEIFPAPKTKNGGKEFVEIINISDEKINLSGLRIEDEKNHKVTFPDESLDPAGLFVLEGNFEINNTSADSAYLITKNGTKENPIDSVSYEKPEYDYSYSFDGTAWQWTSKVTKGAKNEFDKLLSGKIKKDKKIYANVYANFEVDADKKAKKFTWNFGDGHKSYLKKTRHKYEKSGTYDASLKITGEGKENLFNFTVKVEKFGKTKVQLMALSANPKGKDSDNEWLEIFNGTKKKVNLKNWSVATGWKNLYNHPIKKDFILKAGETKKLTRKLCAFTLGNKQTKIELRYPDGKVADKLKYDRKDKSVSEDELYQKTGNAWQWVLPEKELKLETQSVAKIKPAVITPEIKIEEPQKADFDLSDLGKSTKNPAWHQRQEQQFALLFTGSNISPAKLLSQNQGQVLGVSVINLSSKKHTEDMPSLHFSNQLWKKINAKLNEFILMF